MGYFIAVLQSRLIQLIVVILLAGLALPNALTRPARAPRDVRLAPAPLPNGGRIVGFRKDRVYLAADRRAYQQEFQYTQGVEPQLTSGQTRVDYPNLWPGISARYENPPQGQAKTRFTLAAGADPAFIRIKYNAPVEIQPDGSLLVRTASGELSETAVRAWQVIDGRQVTIPTALVVWDNHEVSVMVEEYNPDEALYIER